MPQVNPLLEMSTDKPIKIIFPPMRLVLRRVRGFDLQALSRSINGRDALNCARPAQLGNPFHVTAECDAEQAAFLYRRALLQNGSIVNDRGKLITIADIQQLARGKNCACFCHLHSPFCHVDTILEVANR